MKTTYRGSCHCGRTKFEVDTDLDHVRACDCSICHARGALNHRVPEGDVRILTPLGEMSVYEWNTKQAKDYFCPVCGILPFRRPRNGVGIWTVNVRCLEGVDLDKIPVKRVFGSELTLVEGERKR